VITQERKTETYDKSTHNLTKL